MNKHPRICNSVQDMLKLVGFALFLFTAQRGMAVTYYVAPGGNDAAAGTNWHTALRTITNAVAKGNVTEVILTNGTHVLTAEVYISKAITVRGMTTNRNLAIVDGNYPNTTNRCFWLSTGAVVADMTITNGCATPDPTYANGGGVRAGVGYIRNCLVTGNRATFRGGGVWINPGGMTNSVVTGNYCAGDGGGVYVQGASKVVDSVISNNTAWGGGGGIYPSLGPVVERTDIVNNQVIRPDGGVGGGVLLGNNGVITNCLIAYNRLADGRYHGGGGVQCGSAGGIISHTRIIGNHAGTNGPGGGISFRNTTAPSALVHDCYIVSNISAYGGGVAIHVNTIAEIRNSLIAHNIATNHPGALSIIGYGGGVFVNSPGVFVNCTIAENTADTGTGGVRSDGNGTLVNCAIYTNLLHDGTIQDWYNTGTGATYSNCVSSTTNSMPGTGNIAGDARFVDPASGNFRLRTRSPCINAGLNQTWMDTATDLDGNPRRYDGTDVDIGAYEYIPPPSGTLFMGL